MRKPGVQHRISVALVAALTAITGVSMGWSAPPVRAQDEVSAAAITPGMNAMVEDGPLNHRQQPTISAPVLQVLATGTLVSVISGPTAANGYNWWLVTANGTNGYVAGQYLAEPDFPIGTYVWVTGDDVELYAGPGFGNGVVDVVDLGEPAFVVGGPTTANGHTWYQIQMDSWYGDSMIGWILSFYLMYAGEPPEGWYGVNSWIMLDDPPVNVRSGAGTDFRVTGVLRDNYQPVQVTGPPTTIGRYTWYPIITLDGLTGFVAGKFFEGGLHLNDQAIVADGPLNLRATAGRPSTILTTMPNNASIFINNVTPVHVNGIAWFNVTYNGTTGWAAGLYLGDA